MHGEGFHASNADSSKPLLDLSSCREQLSTLDKTYVSSLKAPDDNWKWAAIGGELILKEASCTGWS